MERAAWQMVKYFFGIRPRIIQFTYCYCPGCHQDLVARAGGSDGTTYSDTDLVRYKCGICGTRSMWNFDIAPAPIYIGTCDG